MKFKGICTPAITPHRKDGSIDRGAFAAQIEDLIRTDVHGIITGGSTGEYDAQSMQERLEMAPFAHKLKMGRVPLLIGSVAIRLEDAVAMAEHAGPPRPPVNKDEKRRLEQTDRVLKTTIAQIVAE